jgi:hypothetical protein
MADMNHKPRSGPPPGPWQKGQHTVYDLVVAEVTILRDEVGRVYSQHKLQDEGDVGVASKWPSCGIEQMAFALLTEATRREALLQMLLLESKSPEQFKQLQEMSPEDRQAKFEEMGRKLRLQMNKTINDLAVGAVHEAYLTATAD